MSMFHAVKVVRCLLWKRAIPRWVSVPLLLFACLLSAQPAPARGTVSVLIRSNQQKNPPQDIITVTIEGNNDETLLMNLAQAMGRTFGGQPTFFAYERGTPPFSTGLGLNFQLKVMPRDGCTLPIPQLLETFAPYASHLQVFYQIQGSFAYAGEWQMENKDVRFTVSTVYESPRGAVPPLSWYDTDAIINNSALTSAYLASEYGKKNPRRVPVLILFGLAIVIGVSGGVLFARLLKQWKTEDQMQTTHTPGRRPS